MLLQSLYEAKIGKMAVSAATAKIISYLEKKLGIKLLFISADHYHNSDETGVGYRYVVSGDTRSYRFNWASGSGAEIKSVDVWLGKKHDPDFHIAVNGASFAKALPGLVSILASKTIKVGKHPITDVVAEGILVQEAKKGEFTEDSSVADMIEKLEAGRSFNRSEFIMNYHPENAHAFDTFIDAYGDRLVKQGKRYSLPRGMSFADVKAGGDTPEISVSRGGSGEDYEIPELDALEADDRVSFAESLEHLAGLTHLVTAKATNALFVAGAGGVGKTQTVEDTLEAAGLSDGAGYVKVVGSASPIGIYTALFKNQDSIILFDDCDGALESQDGRNIIKNATDTRPKRKMAWGKKSAGMYDPNDKREISGVKLEPEDVEDDEDAETADPYADKIPTSFYFTGQIIFISNLPLNKLDPDGALRTRGYIINIDPTQEEIYERMEVIMDKIPLANGATMSHDKRAEVLEVIKKGGKKNRQSLRTLVRALNVAASGAPNWEVLVKLYC